MNMYFVRYLSLLFLNSRWRQVFLDEKSSQKYPVKAGVPQDFILIPTCFLLYIDDFPDDFFNNAAIYNTNKQCCCKY